ncbi:MAG TPA: SNF2-related protein [Anaerolineales bacterium]|nr:SNF2-related protein [Anaerolineales bacterium]
MAGVRKTTGKAVSPLRRPSIAGVRELRMPTPGMIAFPIGPDLRLVPDEPQLEVEKGLAVPTIISYEAALSASPAIVGLGARVPRPEFAAHAPDFAPAVFEGVGLRKAASDESLRPGPPWLDRVAPLLLAPAHEPDIAAALGARPYQIEAAQTLLANPRFLLADDAGTGKLRGACLALAVLAGKGQVRRALISAPPERLPAWRTELEAFLPELSRCEIRGSSAEREEAWKRRAFIFLASVEDVASDIQADVLLPGIDLLILDRFVALVRRRPDDVRQLSRLQAEHRWALAGSVPIDAEDWRVLLGFLMPDVASSPARPGTGELRERFTQNVLRRSKAELVQQMPRVTRSEVWIELDRVLAPLYNAVWANERGRLQRLGSALSRSHVQASLDTLKQICNFAPETYDGPKVRALVDLAEEITSGRSKLVVFTTYGETTASRLLPALEAFGALHLRADASTTDQEAVLARFRAQPGRRILVADIGARGDGGSLDPATYVVHFDHDWNPALRRRHEQRFFPELRPSLPLNIYELWVAGTVEQSYHRALESRRLLATSLSMDTQPADLVETLSLEQWRKEVFDAEPTPPRPSWSPPAGGTGSLPGTGTLRSRLGGLTADEWASAAEGLLRARGFDTTRRLTAPEESGLSFIACRPGGGECVLVRCLRTVKTVGVAEARQTMEDADKRPDCDGAYLLTMSDFTPACKKFAEETGGRLMLLGGVDVYRHLRSRGMVP